MTVTIKVRVRPGKKPLPDWGLGPGVLIEQEIKLLEEVTEESKVRFALMLREQYESLLEQIVEPIYEYHE